MQTRDNWHQYFMGIAKQAATRATCDRKHVGAVIVQDRSIISTGYNGAIAGMPHCTDVGHLMEHDHCVRTVHAEVNAIAQAAKRGMPTEGATIYVTANPCWNCFKTIANAGIKTIVYGELYRDQEILNREIEVAETVYISIARLLADGSLLWAGAQPEQPTINI